MKSEKGSAIVEFAVIVPIVVMLVFGIFEIGVTYSKYIALTHAAREGARLAAVGLAEDPDFDFEQAVRERAPSVEIETITVENPEGTDIGDPVVVTVTGKIFFIEIPMAGRWGPVQLKSQAIMRREQ